MLSSNLLITQIHHNPGAVAIATPESFGGRRCAISANEANGDHAAA